MESVESLSFLHTPPREVEPWRTIAAQNTPGQAPTAAPILLTHGEADTIVAASVTATLARRLCARGERVELHTHRGAVHMDGSKVAAATSRAGSPTAPPAARRRRPAADGSRRRAIVAR